jgi:hypothetical protein
MSNHDGGAMLNQILHGLVDSGLLKEITAPQKRSLRKLLSSMTWDYDCNWGEIIDIDLAMLLSTCADCRGYSAKICPENGYCRGCNEEARQGEILWGEISLLRELLDYRFGDLPHWVQETMRGATEEEILRWSERLLRDASSLEEVFGTSGQG